MAVVLPAAKNHDQGREDAQVEESLAEVHGRDVRVLVRGLPRRSGQLCESVARLRLTLRVAEIGEHVQRPHIALHVHHDVRAARQCPVVLIATVGAKDGAVGGVADLQHQAGELVHIEGVGVPLVTLQAGRVSPRSPSVRPICSSSVLAEEEWVSSRTHRHRSVEHNSRHGA
eukprot:4260412-Prymnesium_polylepis.1